MRGTEGAVACAGLRGALRARDNVEWDWFHKKLTHTPHTHGTPVVNKEWEFSHKKGFKCTFDRSAPPPTPTSLPLSQTHTQDTGFKMHVYSSVTASLFAALMYL